MSHNQLSQVIKPFKCWEKWNVVVLLNFHIQNAIYLFKWRLLPRFRRWITSRIYCKPYSQDMLFFLNSQFCLVYEHFHLRNSIFLEVSATFNLLPKPIPLIKKLSMCFNVQLLNFRRKIELSQITFKFFVEADRLLIMFIC